METESSLPHSQQPATCPYPQPYQSSPCPPPPSHILKIHLNIILPSKPGSSRWYLCLRLSYKNPVCISPSPIRATCVAHLIFSIWSSEQHRGADKSLARLTFRCILFDGENISFDAGFVIYIYIYIRVCTALLVGRSWDRFPVVSLGIFSVVPPTEPCVLRSTQPLKVSTRDFSWGKGGRCVWLTTYHPCSAETSRKSRALTYPEPLGPPRPVAGELYFTLLYFTYIYIYIYSTNIPPIMTINRIYEHQNLLSL